MTVHFVCFTALGFHLGILGDRNIAAAGALIAAADAGTIQAAGGSDFRAAGDGDVAAAALSAAADAGTFRAALGGDFCAFGDDDVAATAASAAADAGTSHAALGSHFRAAADGDVAAAAESTAADAGTTSAAGGGDFRIAGDGDVAAAAVRAAADAGTTSAAGGLQGAGSSVFVCNGQLAVTAIGGGVLLHTGTFITALEGIFPIQLQGHIAVAGDLYSRFTAETRWFTCFDSIIFATGVFGIDVHAVQGHIGGSAVRHIDGDRRLSAVILGRAGGVTDDNVHILYGHIGSGVLRRIDGDGVFGGGAAVALGDDGCAVRHRSIGAVGNGLPRFRGVHSDTAHAQVIFLRKGG